MTCSKNNDGICEVCSKPLKICESHQLRFQRGYEVGLEVGYERANHRARQGLRTLRFMQYTIAAMLGIAISLLMGNIQEAKAATAQTSVNVVITAEVPCNPENCPEPGADTPLQIESVQPEGSLWSRVIKWVQELFE